MTEPTKPQVERSGAPVDPTPTQPAPEVPTANTTPNPIPLADPPLVPLGRVRERNASDRGRKTTRQERRKKRNGSDKKPGSGRLRAELSAAKKTAEDDQRLALESKIWHLRMRGYSNPEIARSLEIRDQGLVWSALDRWRKRLTDTIVDFAAIERYSILSGLEHTNKRLFSALDSVTAIPDLTSIVNTIRGNYETIARMQGHNAPTEIISRTTVATPEEARRLINERFAGAQAAEQRRQSAMATGPDPVAPCEPNAPSPESKPPA